MGKTFLSYSSSHGLEFRQSELILELLSELFLCDLE